MNINCEFTQGYTEGSKYKGFFGLDNFHFENEVNSRFKKNYKMIFGCAM